MVLVNGKNINLMQFKIFPIAGDASFRKFYRIKLNKKSQIIVSSKKDKFNNLVAYSAVNKFLRNKNILTPKLYSHDYSQGIIVIQDFGDLTFNKILAKQKNKFKTYKKITDLLLKIQKIKPKSKIKTFIGKSHKLKKYTKKYLHKESDLFFDWYLPLILNKKKVLEVKKKAKKSLSNLYKILYFPNTCFVHRDFHAQNLMKVGGKIGVIDSQDSLIGNPTYDLVSLIDDVRIKTSKKLKDKIYKYYLQKTSKVYRIRSDKFIQDYNILSVQRSLKIIGIFSRLAKRDKKNKYLKLIPYTWSLLESRIRTKIFSDLKKILDHNIPSTIRKKILK